MWAREVTYISGMLALLAELVCVCEYHSIIMSGALGCCVTSSPNLFWIVGCGKVCWVSGVLCSLLTFLDYLAGFW